MQSSMYIAGPDEQHEPKGRFWGMQLIIWMLPLAAHRHTYYLLHQVLVNLLQLKLKTPILQVISAMCSYTKYNAKAQIIHDK